MKIISGNLHHINVVEDTNYKQHLQRADGLAIRLYQVQTKENERTVIQYVLAEDERGALSQCCNTDFGVDPVGIATRLPLHVRGWGHIEF